MWKYEPSIYWIVFIILMFLGWLGGLARADVVEDTQKKVVEINKAIFVVVEKVDEYQYCLDSFVPLDDFKVEVKDRTIGFSFTF